MKKWKNLHDIQWYPTGYLKRDLYFLEQNISKLCSTQNFIDFNKEDQRRKNGE